MTTDVGHRRRKRAALLAAGVAAAATLALVAWRRPTRAPARAGHAENEGRAAARAPAPAPYRDRRDFPPATAGIGAARGAAPSQSPRAALTAPPPPPSVIHVGDDQPPPAVQTGSGWATDYRDAVCACSTRSCVRDLQSDFIRKLGGVTYTEARDAEAYHVAVRAALRCYGALPEDS